MEFKIGHTATVQFTGTIIDCEVNRNQDIYNFVTLENAERDQVDVLKKDITSVDPPPFTPSDGDIVLASYKRGNYNRIIEWEDSEHVHSDLYTYTLVCKKENREDLREQAEEPSN